MTAIRVLMAAAGALLFPVLSHADASNTTYEHSVRCERSALDYYNETEQAKNISNNTFFYESFVENHYNAGASKCFVFISSMLHRYRDDTAIWTDSLIDIESRRVFASLSKTVNLKSNTVENFRCDINGNECASKNEFRTLIKPYMED